MGSCPLAIERPDGSYCRDSEHYQVSWLESHDGSVFISEASVDIELLVLLSFYYSFGGRRQWFVVSGGIPCSGIGEVSPIEQLARGHARRGVARRLMLNRVVESSLSHVSCPRPAKRKWSTFFSSLLRRYVMFSRINP
jgi:hypothetical protein